MQTGPLLLKLDYKSLSQLLKKAMQFLFVECAEHKIQDDKMVR